MKAYVAHKKGLQDRIINTMNLLCQCHTIEDIEIVTSETSNLAFTDYLTKRKYLSNDFPIRDLSASEKSLYHKHYRILEKIAQQNAPSIIFEDDVQFLPEQLDEFVNEISQHQLDFVFFGTGCGLSLGSTGFVENTNRLKSKCTDSMYVSPKAAAQIINHLQTIGAMCAIDWDLNYIFSAYVMTIHWFEPGFITQGSQNGTYKSEIQA